MSSTPSSSRRQRLLAGSLRTLFGEVSEEFLTRLSARMQTLELPGGHVLMREGEPSDAMYLVLAGRLRAMQRDADGHELLLGEIGRGEPVGEMGVITGQTRIATVTALRDSLLLRLRAEDFAEVVAASPGMGLRLARTTLLRVQRNLKHGETHRHVVNLCVLPLSAGLDSQTIGRQLAQHLATQLDRSRDNDTDDGFRVAALAWPDAQSALHEHDQADPAGRELLLDWLDEQEEAHAMLVLCADAADSDWTRQCLRHADHVLLLADASDDPGLRPIEQSTLIGAAALSSAQQSLWLMHPADRAAPRDTGRWLQARPQLGLEGWTHFHTRTGHAGDWARLARILAGQATAVVMAGGGARGFAQLGVLQALEEEGIEWDLCAGTSIGAVMAAYAAMDRPMAQCIDLARHAFARNPTGDINWLPLMSVVRGERLGKVISGGIDASLHPGAGLEDLWKPFFCVVSNYSRERMEVLHQGPLAQALRATVAIPAALPPVLRGGDLLTDGGTFNNYPVDLMRARGASRVIGVDHGRGRYRPLALDTLPTPGQLLVDRWLRPRSKRRYKGVPTLAAMVFNMSAMASSEHEQRMREAADLAFTPDVSRIGMLQWGAFNEAVGIGLKHARERLQLRRDVFQPSWYASRHTRR